MPGPVRLMVFEGYQPGYGFFNAFGALSRPLLRVGAKGPEVAEAQNALMKVLAKSIPGGADGVFGSNTEQAVREAQARFGLTVNGMVDANTWTLLLGQEVAISGVPTGASPGSGGTTTPVNTNIPGVRPPVTGAGPVPTTPPVDISIGGQGPVGEASGMSGTMKGLAAVAVIGFLAFLVTRKKGA